MLLSGAASDEEPTASERAGILDRDRVTPWTNVIAD